jgi:hypothetical protein
MARKRFYDCLIASWFVEYYQQLSSLSHGNSAIDADPNAILPMFRRLDELAHELEGQL